MNARPGMLELDELICEPQDGQNRRVITAPESAVRAYALNSPVTETADSSKHMFELNAVPLVRRQSPQ